MGFFGFGYLVQVLLIHRGEHDIGSVAIELDEVVKERLVWTFAINRYCLHR